jgi:predicted nucleic acid-binding protein
VIVVDASALSAFVLREEGWRDLAGYLAYAVAPDHVVKEVANAVWKAARTGTLTGQEARKALSLLLRMVGGNLLLEPELKYLEKAFEISLAYSVTVYDALYIALALEKSLPLLTFDKEQRRVAGALGVRVKP